MFYLSMSSEEFGGEIFGDYDTPEDAAQSAARILLEAHALHDGIARAFLIVEADSKAAAGKKIDQYADFMDQLDACDEEDWTTP